MRPIIYSISPKDLSFNPEEKSKYIVIKTSDFIAKNFINIGHKSIVQLIDNNKFVDSEDNFCIFKVEKNISKIVQKFLKIKLDEFVKQHGSLKEKSLNDVLKFLEANGSYHFEIFPSNEELNKPSAPIKLPELQKKEEIVSSQDFLAAERGFSPLSRSNSLCEAKIDAESLRRASSLPGLAVENSKSTESIESSASSLESLENESLKLNNDQLVQAIQSVFFKENQTLLNINKHASSIQNGRFNGFEKSTYLEEISRSAETIDFESRDLLNNSLSEVNVEALKHKIDELKTFINDKETIDVLSRYRGLSPLRCFATLWGGGKVKSIEYVEQLQEQLDTLTKNIAETRPTV